MNRPTRQDMRFARDDLIDDVERAFGRDREPFTITIKRVLDLIERDRHCRDLMRIILRGYDD